MVFAMENMIHSHESILYTFKENLAMAQNHMKEQTYQHLSKCSVEIGAYVFLHLQPYK